MSFLKIIDKYQDLYIISSVLLTPQMKRQYTNDRALKCNSGSSLNFLFILGLFRDFQPASSFALVPRSANVDANISAISIP